MVLRGTGTRGMCQCIRPSRSPAPYPHAVKNVILKGQTAAIPATTLFTPRKDGLYRVSVYMVTTTANNDINATWNTTMTWTDDAGPWSLTQWMIYSGNKINSVLCCNSVANLTATVKAGTPLTYSVDPAGGDPTGSTYELFSVVEQLM